MESDQLIISRYKFYQEGKIEILSPKETNAPKKFESKLVQVKKLIEKGLDVKKKYGMYENQLIHYVCYKQDIETLKYLIEIGIDIESENNYGERPIHISCNNGCLEIVKLLIEQGANIEAETTNTRERPIHCACSYNHLEIVKLLLEKNVNIDVKDNYNNTPLTISVRKKDLLIYSLLIEYSSDVNVEIGYKDNVSGLIPLLYEFC